MHHFLELALVHEAAHACSAVAKVLCHGLYWLLLACTGAVAQICT